MKIPLVILGWWWSVRKQSWSPQKSIVLFMGMKACLGDDLIGRMVKKWLDKELIALDQLEKMSVTQVGVVKPGNTGGLPGR